ncbi:hypothetical protein HPB51_017007 [Rhipicephalus microplus]|uniref:Uncharacterized protein n=1 Tax=Rhipicephalus microplus TaxID=6941 RepID=A0A9J6F443_RHIMP|nr:hypothetical protein HPB51_017007 [Rhipicephalus microplus]
MTYLPEHDHSKPGRQVITFLLIGNLTLWIIYTFEKQKVEASPVQLGFYGFMAWTVIIRASLPLSIFYRFHSSVTFAEVWKNSYRNMGAKGKNPAESLNAVPWLNSVWQEFPPLKNFEMPFS